MSKKLNAKLADRFLSNETRRLEGERIKAIRAAAGDLLVACKMAINTLNGLSVGYVGLDRDGHYVYESDVIDHVETVLAAAIAKAEGGDA